MDEGKKIRLNIPLDAETHKLLKIKVAEEGTTISGYVAELIKKGVNKKENA